MKWENMYLVFEVEQGPKVVIETLNTYGNQGWELTEILPIGQEHLVAFLKRMFDVVMPDPKKAQEDKVKALWGADGEVEEDE